MPEPGARRIDEDPVELAGEVELLGVGRRHLHGARAQPRDGPGEGLRPSGVALDGDDRAAVTHPGSHVGGLPTRRRAQVEDALPRLRIERRRDAHRGARLRLVGAGGEERVAVGVERPFDDEPLVGQLGGAAGGDGQGARERLGVGDERVDAQRELRGPVRRREHLACLLGAELLPPEVDDPARLGVVDRGVRGRRVAGQPRALAGRAAQHGVHQAVAATALALGLGELDALGRPRRGRARRRGTGAGRARAAARRRRRGRACGPAARASAMWWSIEPRRWIVPNVSWRANARSRPTRSRASACSARSA